MMRNRFASGMFAFLCAVFCSLSPTNRLYSQGIPDSPADAASARSDIPAVLLPATTGLRETSAEIMQRQALAPPPSVRPEHELEYPDRSHLLQNPDAPAVAQYPAAAQQAAPARPVKEIHTTNSSFDGATLTDTGAFPPDSMGTVGPTQFVTFVNGRIRSFTKAGTADSVLNADPDVFFASVMTPVGGSVVLSFTSDPQVRYDRFTARWYMTIIDVPCTNATCTTTAPNRVLMAVSDAASNGTITNATVWTFFQFQADPGTNFCDYPSLGVDVNALYIGCNMFSNAGSFVGTNGYVVRKSTALGAGPLTVTMFANLAAGAGSGPESPRGVDNYDATATEGYFVGPDNALFSTIMFRRVSNPGSATPTISANISVTVTATTLSGTQTTRLVQHAGNTGGNNGLLDSLDDRFYAAMIRNGRLWAAHNFTVTNAGVASTASTSRNAARWYEFQNLTTTPTVVQSGTVFDNAATRAAARQYWMPTVAVTGQGHAVMGMTMAGTPVGATPVYVGRLAGDTLGTMVGPPTASAVSFGTTSANYNPASDPGGTSGRRWGDYSYTALDPLDDMTVWTIQEYNQALNSYAVRVGHLQAPPPATPTCSGTPINFIAGTGNVTIDATSSGGSGFYDPGANLPSPALPFNHLNASMSNGTVNSATYNSPTQVSLNITANTGGLQNVTITNPDGQSVTANGCINVIASAVASKLKFTTQPVDGTAGQTLAAVVVSVEDSSGNVIATDNTTQVTLALSSNTLNGTLTKTAVNGVATFSNLSINTAATGYTLIATSTPVLTPDTSSTFNIAAASASKLVFAQQPSNAAAAATITPAVTVQVRDAFDNVVTGDSSAVALTIANNPGGAVLSGTTTRNAIAGVATFNNLSLDKPGGGYTLAAADGALTGATSSAFNIGVGAPAQLAYTTQPATNANVTAGAPINLVVEVRDSGGNLVASDTSTVTISIQSNPGTSTLSGTASVAAVGGVATFSNLSLNKSGSGYTLRATDSNIAVSTATSNAFNIVPAAATHIGFAQQPTNTVAGAAIAPAVAVEVLDAFGNRVTSSTALVKLAVGIGPSTTISGGGPLSASAGLASFPAATLQAAGNYTLKASSSGFADVTSNAFNVAIGPFNRLVVTQQPPVNATAGSAFTVKVELRDAFGNVLVGDNTSSVTAALSANPGGDAYAGNSSTASAGVATFSVTLTKAASGYQLGFTSGAVSVQSVAFAVAPASAASLAFVQQPAATTQGTRLATISVEERDAFGNRVTTDSATSVNVTVAACGGPVVIGTATVSSGLATFTPGSAIAFYTVANGLQLQASSGALTSTTSQTFDVTANPDATFADGFEGCRL
jgi:hypothetical protein